MTEQSVAAVLTRAQRELAQLENPRFEASILLCHHLQWPDSKLISHSDQMLSPDQTQGFSALVQRRASGEPSAYITGERAFWTLELQVTPDTLIPRPDTEILVEQCLLLLQGKASPRVLDMGTGSGAIALAIASERTDAIVEATDISPSALAVAQNNAQLNGLNLHAWHQGSWFEALPTGASGYDLIVSNPPYVDAEDMADLPLEFTREPELGLASG
ncbi:MAG: peptide chain release factor N(5)-glutamine methyltransferase, partial [Granulosicoccaceae bacterium]